MPAASDLSIWLAAPKERTAAYFPTYSAIARQIQAAMRCWASEWFYANPDILSRPRAAQPLLLYICTTPFRGKPTNRFTYDPHSGMLEAALSSAAFNLKSELEKFATDHLDWHVRETYFSYRRDTIVESVRRNSHGLVRMLNVDTSIMDDFLKFVMIDLPRLGLDRALKQLRKNMARELKRFSSEFDLSHRCDDILELATIELYRLLSPQTGREIHHRSISSP